MSTLLERLEARQKAESSTKSSTARHDTEYANRDSERTKRFVAKFNQRLDGKYGLDTEEGLLAFSRQVVDQAQDIEPTESMTARKRRWQVANLWEQYVTRASQTSADGPVEALTPDELWREVVVDHYMYMFFVVLVDITPPRKGFKTIKASTLVGFLNVFLSLVLRYVTNAKGEKYGYAFLQKNDRLQKLKDNVTNHTRYLKLGDIKVFRLEYMSWKVELHISNFKMFGGAIAEEKFFTLDPVKHGHNLPFEAATYLVLSLFLRNAFATKYNSWDEFCNSNEAQIPIDPDQAQEPLFRACDKGNDPPFLDPPQPCMAPNMIQQFAHFCTVANLPRSGFRVLRRSAGNSFGLQFGSDVAANILNHDEARSTFNKYYSRTTANFNLQGIRLGEVAGPLEKSAGEIEQSLLERNELQIVAVQCMVKRQIEPISSVKQNISEIEKNDPSIQAHSALINAKWVELASCLVSGKTPRWGHSLYGVKAALKQWKADANRSFGLLADEPDEAHRCFKRDQHQAAGSILAELQNLYPTFTTIKRKVRRLLIDDITSKAMLSYKFGPALGTAEQHREALKELTSAGLKRLNTKASHAAQEAIEKSLGNNEIVEQVIESFKPSHSESTDAITCPEHLSEDTLNAWLLNMQNRIIDEHADQEQQDEDDKEGLDDAPIRLLNFLPGSALDNFAMEVPEDEDGAGCEPNELSWAEIEDMEEDVLKLPVTELRKKFIQEYLIKPIVDHRQFLTTKLTDEQREGLEVYKPASSLFQCPECDHVAPSKSLMEKHMTRTHSAWTKFLNSFDVGKSGRKTLVCPHGDYKGIKLKHMKAHLTLHCTNRSEYAQMEADHNSNLRYPNSSKSKQKTTVPLDENNLDIEAKNTISDSESESESRCLKRKLTVDDDDESNGDEGIDMVYSDEINSDNLAEKLKTGEPLSLLLQLLTGFTLQAESSGLSLETILSPLP